MEIQGLADALIDIRNSIDPSKPLTDEDIESLKDAVRNLNKFLE